MRKNVVLIAIAILLCMPLHAQKLKKAFDLLKQSEYDEAEILFNRATKNKVEPAAAYFALGKILIDPESGRYDTYKAFEMFQNSKDKFLKTPPKTADKYKIFYGIKPSDADSMMRVVAEIEHHTIRKSLKPSIEKFNRKFKFYKDLCADLKFYQDSLTYRRAYAAAANRANFAPLLDVKKDASSFYHDSVDVVIPIIISEIHDVVFHTALLYHLEYFRSHFTNYTPRKSDVYYFFNQLNATDTIIKNNYTYTLTPEDTTKLFILNKFEKDTTSNKYSEENLVSLMKQLAPTEFSFYILKSVAAKYIAKKQFNKAVDIYLKYRSLFPIKHKQIDDMIGLLTEPNPPQLIDDHRLPDAINSPLYRSDYAPIVTPDLKKIYFCQDMDMRGYRQEDMYMSQFKDGKWQVAQPVERFATMENNESAEHIYPDENMMSLFLNGSIMLSDRQDNGSWGYPYRLEGQIDKDGNSVNSGRWQADSYFSADGQVLLFASIRSTNIEGKNSVFEYDFNDSWFYPCDIYVSLKQPNGEWGVPINLGPVINTPTQDRSPQLAPDLHTLFFTSDGHPGIGGCDIFMSRRLSDTSWTQWSQPVNLGRIINTAGEEQFFNLGFDGKTVVYERDEAIYTGIIPDQFRAATTSILSGVVTDSEGKPLKANIVWEDIATGIHLGTLSSDPVTGKFSITMPLGRRYEIFIEAAGFVPQSDIFDNSGVNSSQFKNDSIALRSINELKTSGNAATLNNVFFETGKTAPLPESMGEIRHLATFLKSNPDLTIEIFGHADAIKAELIKFGIPPFKIIANDNGNHQVQFRIME